MDNVEEMRRLAQKANERKEILPTLEFTPDGDKHAEGKALVRFVESGFTTVVNKKAKPGQPSEFYTVNVELLENSDFGQAPGRYQLLTAKSNSTLTDGILKVWQQRNENLEGAVVAIETYNYDHRLHGKTRGYRVARLKDRESA